MARSAATNDTCEARELLPPLLEPVMAGILEVLKSSDFRPLRRDAVSVSYTHLTLPTTPYV